jgi:hypothetical protein
MGFSSVFGRDKKTANDITFVECLSYPVTSIVENFKAFFILSGVVSLVVSLVTFLSGRGFFCSLQIGSFCYHNGYMMIISCLINLYGMAFFINRWQMVVNQKKSALKALCEKSFTKDMKALGVLLLYFLFWGIISGCAVALKQRVVTENVSLELGYFVVFSGIIIFCLLLLLNFVGFYHYLHGGEFFTLHKTIGKSCDNLYTLVAVFFIYMLIFVFLLFRGEGFFRGYLGYGVIIEYLSEFYLYFIFCTILSVFVGSFEYQEKKLFTAE